MGTLFSWENRDTETTQETDPTEPTDPTETTQDTDPTDPTDSTQPTDPTNPTTTEEAAPDSSGLFGLATWLFVVIIIGAVLLLALIITAIVIAIVKHRKKADSGVLSAVSVSPFRTSIKHPLIYLVLLSIKLCDMFVLLDCIIFTLKLQSKKAGSFLTPTHDWQAADHRAPTAPSVSINFCIKGNECHDKEDDAHGDERTHDTHSPSGLTFPKGQIGEENETGNDSHHEASNVSKVVHLRISYLSLKKSTSG